MAVRTFIGLAQARVQQDAIVVGGTWAALETATIRIGGKFVIYHTTGADATTVVAAGLQAAAAASTDAEFREITWTVVGSTVYATSVAGIPFTLEVSETSTSGTLTPSTTQAATGPYHWDDAENWSGTTVPTSGDDVYLEHDLAVKYGLPTSLTIDSLTIRQGELGLPVINPSGYTEYRTTRAVITCTDVTIGQSQNIGPRLVRLSLASANAVVLVTSSRASYAGVVPIDLLLNHSSASVNVIGGHVGIALAGAEVSVVGTVRVAEAGRVELGTGVTLTSLYSTGNTRMQSGATNVIVDAGTVEAVGTAAITNLTVQNGRFIYNSTGTITAAIVGPGVLDCGKDIRPRTITDLELKKGGVFADPYSVITVTNGIELGSDADHLQAV